MATIEKYIKKDGSTSFTVQIRKKGIEITRTFFTEEDAKLFEFYKERLIDNMNNFDVPLHERVTISSLFELKENRTDIANNRALSDLKLAKERTLDYFKDKLFYHEISYDEWVKCADHFYQSDVYKGAKNENGKRKMSLATLIKLFRVISAVVSNAQFQGISIENHPLKVIQTYLYPKEK